MQFKQFRRAKPRGLSAARLLRGRSPPLRRRVAALGNRVLANQPWPPLEGLRHALALPRLRRGKDPSLRIPFCQRACGAVPCPGVRVGQPSGRPDCGLGYTGQSCRAQSLQHDTDCHVCRRPCRRWHRFEPRARAGTSPGCRCKWRSKRENGWNCSRRLLPSFSRVAVLSNPSNPYCAIAVGRPGSGRRDWACNSTLWTLGFARPRRRIHDAEPQRS